jgi:hypothetical protein
MERGGEMKARTALASLAVFITGVALSLAADPNLGSWKLNDGKSKLPPGASRITTVTYAMAGDSVKITVDGTGADGKPIHNEWTGKYDGKDYPVTGDPNSDMRAYTKVDDRTLDFNAKKGGKVYMTGRVAVAADGKSRTVTTTVTDASGKQSMSTAVYDKQ